MEGVEWKKKNGGAYEKRFHSVIVYRYLDPIDSFVVHILCQHDYGSPDIIND